MSSVMTKQKIFIDRKIEIQQMGCLGIYSEGGVVGARICKKIKLYLERSSSHLRRMPRNLFRGGEAGA
jgi:hypothetical protein